MASTSENVTSDIVSWLKRQKPKPDFCGGCTNELRQSQTSTNTTSMRFVGPVLVRTMPSYQVLSLPGLCGLYILNSLEKELPRFIDEFRNRAGQVVHQKELGITAFASDEKRDSVLQAIEAAKQDPFPAVRKVAAQLEVKVRSEPPLAR